jgi:hypothetical protein
MNMRRLTSVTKSFRPTGARNLRHVRNDRPAGDLLYVRYVA